MDFLPKSVFAKGPHAAQWTEVASSTLLREAASAALVQMQFNQGYSASPTEAMAKAYQMEGARAFLDILMNLTTPPKQTPERPKSENLDHSV